jgi:hypothetical protein
MLGVECLQRILYVGATDDEVCEQYSRFSELAPEALNIDYNVCRSTSALKCLKLKVNVIYS